jgi:apolipoprotein N-acyltransferase
MAQVESVGFTGRSSAQWVMPVLRIGGGIAAAAVSGVIATLAFPPYEAWPLIFVAFIPLVIAQHRILPVAWSPLAPGVTIGVYFAGQLSAGLADGNVAWFIQLWPLYVAILIAALCWPGRRFHARTDYRWLAISFPLAWTAIDAARALSGVDVLAGTWGNVAYALYEQAWLLQPLSVFGVFGAELLILVINFALAHAVIAILDARVRPVDVPAVAMPAALRSLGAVALVSIGWVGLSLLLFDPQPGTLRVATVQSNAPIDAEEEFQRVIVATRDLGAQGAKIVVWREGGLKFDPLRERTDVLKALAAETGAYLAVGYRVNEANGLRRNEAVVFSPTGETYGPYGKDHPGRFAGDQSDTGGTYKVYETALGRIATIICYDLDFTDTAREMARRGAQFIAVPSNDVPAIARTHYTHLVFRAIENRLPLAKADSMFDTAIIDPHGRILARNVSNVTMAEAKAVAEARSMPTKTLIADVPLGTGDTLSVRLGDWIGWLAIALAAAFAAVRYVPAVRERLGWRADA